MEASDAAELQDVGQYKGDILKKLRGYYIVNFSLTTLGTKPKKPYDQRCSPKLDLLPRRQWILA
jgi:hypothetical protein